MAAGQELFFLWGESLAVTPRKGRQTKPAAHPFQTPIGDLSLPGYADKHTTIIWLPSVGKAPCPSPELIASGAAALKGSPTLRVAAWRVAGFLLPIDPTIDFLLALPAHNVGADLSAWRMATLLALEIVAGQQVLPALARDGTQLRATWQPRPAPPTAQPPKYFQTL